jgi:hypothetical protein
VKNREPETSRIAENELPSKKAHPLKDFLNDLTEKGKDALGKLNDVASGCNSLTKKIGSRWQPELRI